MAEPFEYILRETVPSFSFRRDNGIVEQFGNGAGASLYFGTSNICELVRFLRTLPTNPESSIKDAFEKVEKFSKEAGCPIEFAKDGSIVPQPAPTTKPIEINPGKIGGDSAQIQAAPTPKTSGKIGGTRLGQKDTSQLDPNAEPKRPPKAEPHPTHGTEKTQKQTNAGDPVDIFNGELFLRETDIEIPNTILPIDFTRFYRSGPGVHGPLGWNWDHNHNIFIRELQNGDIALWRNLHEDIFNFDGANYQPARGIFEKLVRIQGNSQIFEIKGAGGVKIRFSRPVGWNDGERIPIIWLKDRHGNMLRYSYGADNKLVKVSDDAGRFIELKYNRCGLVSSTVDQSGKKYTYGYNQESEHLVCVCSPSTRDHPEGITKIYHYEKLFAPPELRHNILRVEDSIGNVYLENKYEQDPATWHYARLTEQLVGGFLYQFRYTELQWVPANPVFINIPTLRVEVMNPDFGLETYTFNYRGDLLDRRFRLSKDKSFRVVVWKYEFDEQGNLSSITKPDGSQEINTYDFGNADPCMRGNLLTRELTSAAGFPSPSRIVWRGKYEPNYQLLIEEKNEKNSVTKYRYDFDVTPALPSNSGKLKQISYPDTILPDGAIQHCVTQFEHNTKGQITVKINPDGTKEELIYGIGGDESSRLITSRIDPVGLDIENHYKYDSFGNLNEEIDGNGYSTKSIYNALGQLEAQIKPTINGTEAITFFHYNTDKKLIATEKPKGEFDGIVDSHIIDKNEFDVLGYPIRCSLSHNTSENRVFKLCNDYQGNPLQIINPDESVIKRTIDERGLLVYEEQQGKDGKKVSSKNIYDRTGRLIQKINTTGLKTIHVYDGFGRIVRTELPNGSHILNTWDKNDLLLCEEINGDDGHGNKRLLKKVTYKYDERDRKITEIISSFVDNPAVSVDLESQFFYDEMDRLVKTRDYGGAQKFSFYDNAGRLMKIIDAEGNEDSYTLDNNGNVTQIDSHHKEPSGATSVLSKQFTYDARNRLIQIIEPDGAIFSVHWDDRDLQVGYTNQLGISNEIQYNSFGEKIKGIYDTAGIAIAHDWSIDNMGQMVSYRDPDGQSSKYTFDSLGRLEKVEYPNGFCSKRNYNSNGMIIREDLRSGVVFEYSYDVANRLKTVNNTNCPAQLLPVPQHQYKYDGLDRVIYAEVGTNQIFRNFDSQDRITSETTNGVDIKCIYDDSRGFVDKLWSDGRRERFSYNLNGIVSNITQINRGLMGAGNGMIADFLPSGPNHFGQVEYKNNFKILANYDERKRLVELSIKNAQATDEKIKYRYDTINRRRVEAIIGKNTRISQHNFDEKNRLIISNHGLTTPVPNAFTQVENDAAIGIIQGNSGTAIFKESFSYNDSDERITCTETGNLNKNYTYSNGHRIQNDGTSVYSFHGDGTLSSDGFLDFKTDSMGRVSHIERLGATILEIEYDAFGRPSVVQENEKPKLSYNYFGNYIEQENHNDIPVIQHTIHPISGMQIANHIIGGSFYKLYDGRFNLIGLTDTNGNILETYRYKSFGSPTIFNSAGVELSNSVFGIQPIFGGQRFLSSTGLYLSTKRLMDPLNGIFVSADPKGYIDSPSLYVYVSQNPIDFIDPNGDDKTSNENDDWSIFDNPILNAIGHNTLSFAASLFENAEPWGGNFDTLTRYFGLKESFGRSRFTKFIGRVGSKASYFLDDLVITPGNKFPYLFSKGISQVSHGLSRVATFIAPWGVITNSRDIYESLHNSKKHNLGKGADTLFYGSGLVSSSIGTTSLIGLGLSKIGLTSAAGRLLINVAIKAGPVGWVTAAAAGGYALGQFIENRTGWSTTLSNRAIRNKEIYQDLGLGETSHLLGFPSNVPVVSEVGEGIGWAGAKVYQGGSYVVNKIGDFIESKDWGKTIRPWRWLD